MLHNQVANMSDRDLFHLGELSFNEQFTAMGRPGPQQMDAMKSRQKIWGNWGSLMWGKCGFSLW
jgi:hypothetical protein